MRLKNKWNFRNRLKRGISYFNGGLVRRGRVDFNKGKYLLMILKCEMFEIFGEN